MIDKTNKLILDSIGIPYFWDINSFAQKVRYTNKLLIFLSDYKAVERYNIFYLTKKNGKMRKIMAPSFSLLMLQRWILHNTLYKIRVSEYSYGFVKSNSDSESPLVEVAWAHKNHKYILKIDIKDIYPSISRARVFFLFKNLGYNFCCANMLANICTNNDELPQGAATSARLANILCTRLDARISGYCNKRDITYTRYADDLIFSCDNRNVLHHIYKMINTIIQDEGFEINQSKTRFLSPKNHKVVLGVTINDGYCKADRKLKRKVRAMIHSSIVNGNYSERAIIQGYIAYFSSIEKDYTEKIKRYINKFYGTLPKDKAIAYNNNKFLNKMPDMPTQS